MREFWLWVIVVTLLLFLMFLLFIGILHLEKRMNKADQLIEKAQKLNEKAVVDKSSSASGGL